MNKEFKRITLFGYYGGKYYLLDDILTEIIRIIEKHNIKCVVDVFGGSGKVILSIPLQYNVIRVYNDIDKRLTSTLKILMDNEKREKLINSLEFAIRSRDLFNEFKNSDWNNLSDEDIALRFLYLNAYSFNSDMNTFKINKNMTRDYIGSLINNINKNWKYLRTLSIIENLDYRDVLKKYGNENTLFYLDPPYYTGGIKYKYSFSKQDFINLKELLDLVKAKYILNISENDFDIITEIFGNYTFIKQYRNYVNNKRNLRYEGFWIKED